MAYILQNLIPAFLTSLIRDETRDVATQSLWLGLVYKEVNDGQKIFQWEDGTSVDYAYWKPEDPNWSLNDPLLRVGLCKSDKMETNGLVHVH